MVVKFSPKILGLSVGIFWTVFDSLGLWLRFGFDPGTDVFRFCCVFGVWGYFWPKFWK